MVETDFDIAKAIVEKLQGQDISLQERVLRWVRESLGLAQEQPTQNSFQNTSSLSQNAEVSSSVVQEQSQDIRTFAKSKNPSSAMQTATIIAYYYKFVAPVERRRDTINKDILVDAIRLIGGIPQPKNPTQTLIDTKTYGYLDLVERGEYAINSVGENLVAMTLGEGKASIKSTSIKKKKSIAKKSNIKKKEK